MKLSVIIPCRNAAHTIGQTLTALAEQSWPGDWEVIVADNGSTDHLAQMVALYTLRIRSLRMVAASARSGAAYARNVAIKAATGEGILFCDADDIPAPGWAVAMASALKVYGFVASRLDLETLNAPNLRAAREGTQTTGLQRFPFLPFPHAGAGTLGIMRALHDAVNGFDENIPICEDIDYCMRVQRRDVQLTFVPDAILQCRLRANAQGVYVQALRYAEYEMYLYKQYGAGTLREWWRWRKYAHAWRLLFRRLPELLRTPAGRTILAWRLGRQLGLLKGSLRFGSAPMMVE
ncbi:MAG: glycosyltransferase family 2 protein [Nitrospira sp.]|nr:glycosyltransferase family 2 protein [Nitrospira sp.]